MPTFAFDTQRLGDFGLCSVRYMFFETQYACKLVQVPLGTRERIPTEYKSDNIARFALQKIMHYI
jgi:hypothetical protein